MTQGCKGSSRRALSLVALLLVVGCGGDDVYTLYRASPIGPSMRIHMATFDADGEGTSYNRDNCNLTANLFMKQPGVTVRYWCEPGKFRE